ncbi:MAG: hypothetical protein IH946_09785, partial [Bacteroidetes bacterium]|nr:hypothetical protein [Bacteroidota bacterium]
MTSILTTSKRVIGLGLLLFSFLLISNTEVKATHLMGLDIQYLCISADTFLIKLNLYRDCAGVPAPTSPYCKIESDCHGPTCLNMTLTNVGGTEVSPLCQAQLSNSTCSGGTLPGVEVWSFEEYLVISLADTCDNWVFSAIYTSSTCGTPVCCRNNAIDNLANTNTNIYVEANLFTNRGSLGNGWTYLCNGSPTFTSLPTPYICINQPFNYNHGAVDPDGDSLSYYWTSAMSNTGVNIPYANGYSYSSPITSTPPATIDSVTGQMTMNPIVIENCVVTVLVKEWRVINGVDSLIGTTMRDLQVVVMNCTNQQPQVPSTGISNVSGGTKTDSFSVEICVGDSVSFTFIALDTPNLDNITLTSNVGTSIPGATFTSTPPSFSVTGSFGWRPLQTDVGYNGFVVTVTDDGCPVLGAQWYVFNIIVIDGAYAGPDKVSCGGDSVSLSATGGTTFTWSPSTGLACDTCQTTMAAPAVTTDYMVSTNLGNNCKTRDTVTVTAADTFSTSTSPDDTICQNEVSIISATGNSSYSSYTYSWSPADSLSSTVDSSTNAKPITTTTYYVTVTAPSGCQSYDTVIVNVTGVAPAISAYVDKTNLCVPSTD